MKRAFSDQIVQSSNIEEKNSSSEEEDVVQLNKGNLQKSMKNIPVFYKSKLKSFGL